MEIDKRLRGPECDKHRSKWERYMCQFGLSYVWEVRDYVSGIDENELREGILVVHGTIVYDHYHWYISNAYAINSARDKWHITARLLQTIGYLYNSYEDENETDRERAKSNAKDYIANLKSVCSHYGVTIDGWRAQAVDDCGKALQVIADWDNEDWDDCLKGIISGARELAECVERADFIHCLRIEYRDVDLPLCRVAAYLTDLTDQQKQWLAEYETSAAESQHVETETSAAEAEGSATPQRRVPAELDTPQARQIFAEAVQAGLMDGNYNWRASKVLQSCFAAGMSLTLNLDHKENVKEQSICWEPFDSLFHEENGRSYKENRHTLHGHYKNTGTGGNNKKLPKGIERIFALFPVLEEYI